jgi:hypothetical protein
MTYAITHAKRANEARQNDEEIASLAPQKSQMLNTPSTRTIA